MIRAIYLSVCSIHGFLLPQSICHNCPLNRQLTELTTFTETNAAHNKVDEKEAMLVQSGNGHMQNGSKDVERGRKLSCMDNDTDKVVKEDATNEGEGKDLEDEERLKFAMVLVIVFLAVT